MSNIQDDLNMARRHVTRGRVLIASQEALVGRLKDGGHDCKLPEALLETYYRTQAIFEEDLARLSSLAPQP